MHKARSGWRIISNKESEEPVKHGRNKASDDRKRHMVALLEERLGTLEQKFPNRDWYLSAAGKIEVFITDSTSHYGRRPWYDMAERDIEALARHSSAFIIFVLGHKDNFLVVPAKDFVTHLPEYRDNITADGRYILNLNNQRTEFEQFPNWPLRPYADNLEIIQRTIFS